MAAAGRRYRFLPGLRLAVSGDATAVRHFDREYGSRLETSTAEAEVVVQIDGRSALTGSLRSRPAAQGGHKSVRWTVALGDPDERPLRAAISLRGWPRSFALSLIQGYFVEALISLVAPAAGHVLLPAAAVVSNDDGVVLLGPSGAGKSSVSARVMAFGGAIIGDDQVLIDGAARCTAFPRRMRFYPDLADAAPEAFRALGWRTRLRLRSRGLVDRLTAGYVRPSLAVDRGELDGADDRRTVTIRRVLVLEPRAPGRELECIPEDLSGAVGAARLVFELQRARLAAIAPPDWRALIDETAKTEEQILTGAFRQALLERVQIPAGWSPRQAVAALTEMVAPELTRAEPGPASATGR